MSAQPLLALEFAGHRLKIDNQISIMIENTTEHIYELSIMVMITSPLELYQKMSKFGFMMVLQPSIPHNMMDHSH